MAIEISVVISQNNAKEKKRNKGTGEEGGRKKKSRRLESKKKKKGEEGKEKEEEGGRANCFDLGKGDASGGNGKRRGLLGTKEREELQGAAGLEKEKKKKKRGPEKRKHLPKIKFVDVLILGSRPISWTTAGTELPFMDLKKIGPKLLGVF